MKPATTPVTITPVLVADLLAEAGDARWCESGATKG
jgi:hypothetical protein